MNKLKHVLFGIIIVLFDLAVYVVLGLLLMHFDDTYDRSKGEYWRLASMSFSEKTPYIGIKVWNAINLIAIGYIVYRIVKLFSKRATFND